MPNRGPRSWISAGDTRLKDRLIGCRVDVAVPLLKTLRIITTCTLLGTLVGAVSILARDEDRNSCHQDSDSLGLDLATNRPDWWPKERAYDDYAVWAESLTPSLNRESDSPYVTCRDERRFILLREANSVQSYSRVATVKQGTDYEAYIFFRNGDPSHDLSAASHGTRVFLELPSGLFGPDKITATIRSENALPESVGASAVVQPEIGVSSTYLEVTSAELFNGDGRKIDDIPVSEITGKSGALIGCTDRSGEVSAGCYGHVAVHFTAKRISQFAGVSAAQNPLGPWKNSEVLENATPFWIRFRFVNTGQIPIQSVKVAFRFGMDFPFQVYLDTPRSPYMEGASIDRQNIELDTLVRGVDLGTVEPGDAVNILVPIAVGEGWQEKLCRSGSVDVQVKINSDGFTEGIRAVRIYPENWLC